ncbi:MAG: cyclic nucleotide-binding domain-containing protein [Chitinispirillaceae bacterium]|nr:cyclic nucleotide-binding domain-containing protein [Chitinispirillaceae bacterium]
MTDKSPHQLLEHIVTLKRSSLFSAVATRELEAVAAVAEELCFERDERIVTEGDVGDSLYLIKQGRVVISKRVTENSFATLAELGAGECFGEMSAIDEEVRSASVMAAGDCTLLRISKEALIEVVLNAPLLGVELLKIFVKRLRAANQRIQSLSGGKEKSS